MILPTNVTSFYAASLFFDDHRCIPYRHTPFFNHQQGSMIFSNLIRFPLILISGIYVPLSDMQGWALTLAYYSPLTYLVDLFNAAMIGTFAFSPYVDGGVLIIVCGGFILASRVIQTRNNGDVREKKNVKIRRVLLTRFSSGIKDPALERWEHAFSRDECPGQVPVLQAKTNRKNRIPFYRLTQRRSMTSP